MTLLAAATFGGTYRYPFVFDDKHVIEENVTLKNPSNIPKYFAGPGMEGEKDTTGSYRPFLFTTYALNYILSGTDPSSYRLTDIALHILNSFMVFLLIQALLLPRGTDPWPWSLIAAAVFCLHPVQTESVIYVAARSVVLLTTLFLLAMLLYIKYKNSGRPFWLVLAVASFTLGLFTKEAAAPLVVMFLLMELHYRQKGQGDRYAWVGVFILFIITAFYAIMRFYFLGSPNNPLNQGNPVTHWLTEVSVLPIYLKFIILPFGLSVDHYVPDVTGFESGLLLAGILIVAGIAVLLVRLRKDSLLFALAAWPVLALMPEILIPLGDKMVEYRLYLPIAGTCIFLSAAFQERLALIFKTKTRHVITAAACILLLMSFLSYERSKVWSDPKTLWADAICKSPNFSRPYNNLGFYLLEQKEYENARRRLETAINLTPDYYEAYLNLGKVCELQGDYAAAQAVLEKAIQLKQDDFRAYLNLGKLFGSRGDYSRAEILLRKALKLNPKSDMAYNNLGNVYSGLGNLSEAIFMYKKALELNPQNYNTHYNLGSAFLESGQYQESYKVFEGMIEAFPEKKEVRGVCAGELRRYGQTAMAQRLLLETAASSD